jgi:UDP-N-acetylglucosamine--N-acetylmuramyl-(pentapeptide) pyrophosphoryl-undecaprenol N-acetylglucosamine transferase
MNALSELSALAKPAILIPIPGSHQEANAKYIADKKAAYVLWPKYLTADFLFKKVRELISDQNELGRMRQNIAILAAPDAGQKIVDQIYKICYNE